MIREQELAIEAARQFASVVDQITPEQWDRPMPTDFKNGGGEGWTLRQVINYHAYDDAWIPDMLEGKTMAEVGEDKWRGDILGDDPISSYRSFNDKAIIAIEKLDDPDGIAHLSFGDFSKRDYLLQVISFRGVRAHVLSKIVGAELQLPASLTQGMWDVLVPIADQWRQWGVYDPPLPIAEDAPLQDRMFAALGVQP